MYAECSEEIISRAVNYRMNLITPKELSDDETDGFQTNMREIMRYIKYSDNRKMLETLVEEEQRFKSVERGAVEIINAATVSAKKLSAEKEMADMCPAIQEMREESRREGERSGEIKGAVLFARTRGNSWDEVKHFLMTNHQKSEKEAEELLDRYWK